MGARVGSGGEGREVGVRGKGSGGWGPTVHPHVDDKRLSKLQASTLKLAFD